MHDHIPKQDVKFMVEMFEKMLAEMNPDSGSALRTFNVPVGPRNVASVSFTRSPTAEEVDRLAAHLMFYKDIAAPTDDSLTLEKAMEMVQSRTIDAGGNAPTPDKP